MVAQTNHQQTKYAAENKKHDDLFTNGKNLTTKTPLGDFQVPTPETLLLSQQAITSKGIQVPYKTIVELYPNTQLDLFCSDSSPFRCTTPST